MSACQGGCTPPKVPLPNDHRGGANDDVLGGGGKKEGRHPPVSPDLISNLGRVAVSSIDGPERRKTPTDPPGHTAQHESDRANNPRIQIGTLMDAQMDFIYIPSQISPPGRDDFKVADMRRAYPQ